MERIDILGVGFDSMTMAEAVDRVMELTRSGKTSIVVTPNAEIAYAALKDESFHRMLAGADIIVPDGAGVVLAAKILGTPVRQKVAGIELSQALLPRLAAEGKKLFLLGAKPGVGERAAAKMRELAPELRICGIRDGYFKTDAEVVAAINEARPDVVYVCLGAPKQEIWMNTYKDAVGPCVLMGLGGTLDGLAGEVKRAPALFIKLNLEWFYRLLKQPSRFGRMMSLPKYILTAVRRRLLPH